MNSLCLQSLLSIQCGHRQLSITIHNHLARPVIDEDPVAAKLKECRALAIHQYRRVSFERYPLTVSGFAKALDARANFGAIDIYAACATGT